MELNRLWIWVVSGVAPVLALALVMPQASRSAGAGAPAALHIVFSSEQNGYLTPCGCSSPMLGGIPRLASYLKAYAPDAAVVKVNNGDLTPANGRQDELKAEAIVDSLTALNYDAINLGEKDFRLGLPYLMALKRRFSGALLCGNASVGGERLFPQDVIRLNHLGPRWARVGIVGLLSPTFQDEVAAAVPGVTLSSPAITLRALAPVLSTGAEIRVLLYHGPRSEAMDLARQFPFFQLIIDAHEGDSPSEIEHVRGVTITSAGQDGKYVGDASFAADPNWAISGLRFVALGPDLHDDPTMLNIKRDYLLRVEAEDLLGRVPQTRTDNGDSYAGSQACSRCHGDAVKVWKASGHSLAFATLAAQGEQKDPECVVCHTVGFGRQTGFSSPEKTPSMQDVGCESCHGPALKHTQDPKVHLEKVGEEICGVCHTSRQSPNFDFTHYWPLIKHS